MSATTVELRDDPRCQPGAYLAFEGRLYEAVHLKEQRQSAYGGRRVVLLLHVLDCASPDDVPKPRWLSEEQIEAALLVRAAPTVADTIPA